MGTKKSAIESMLGDLFDHKLLLLPSRLPRFGIGGGYDPGFLPKFNSHHGNDQVDALSYALYGYDYGVNPVPHADMVRNALAKAVQREDRLHPDWWPPHRIGRFDRDAMERGWIHDDGTPTGLGRCVHEFHRSFAAPKVDPGLFYSSIATLQSIAFDVKEAGWKWTDDILAMCEVYFVTDSDASPTSQPSHPWCRSTIETGVEPGDKQRNDQAGDGVV
jgi:hypothetical protein